MITQCPHVRDCGRASGGSGALACSADPAKLEHMIQTTERYCVIAQTLRNAPRITLG